MAVYGYMTITCNAAIIACGKGREWPRALDVLSVMARSSIQIDTITCNADVSAWEKGGECLSQHCYGYVEPTWLQIC